MTHGDAGLSDEPVAADLGAILRAHRVRRGLSGAALATRLGSGISQAKISRIETGHTAPSPEDVRRIAQALRLPADEAEELVSLARRGRPGLARMAEWRHDPADIERKQGEIGDAEQAAREIRVFQPTIVPGLLQTSGYAEAIMRTPLRLGGVSGVDESGAALIAAVGGRIQRQQILKLSDKTFAFVMTEWVLANRLVNPEDMLAQIRRIRQFARQKNVTVRIIPADAPLADAPLNGFQLIDDEWLMIDLYNTSLTSQVVADIEAHQQIFQSMTDASVIEIDGILDKYAELYKGLLGD